jgi:EpsG family
MLKIINILVLYGLIFLVLYISIAFESKNERSKRKLMLLCSVLVVIFLWWRDIGLDLEPYRLMYENYESANSYQILDLIAARIEPVNSLLIQALKSYGFGFSAYILVVSFIPIALITYVILKTDDRPVLALYFFLIVGIYPLMDAIRHFFAAAIYLFAMYWLARKSEFKYYCAAFISFITHYSNIIALFIKSLLEKKWSVWGYIISSILILTIPIMLRTAISSVLGQYFEDSEFSILFKLNYYINNIDDYEYLNSIHSFLLNFKLYIYISIFWMLNLYILSSDYLRSSLNKFEGILLGSQILGSIIALFLLGLGAGDFAFRLCFLMSIGSYALVKRVVLTARPLGVQFVSNRFAIMTLAFLALHLLNVLYLAGIHQPNSPFYLG